MKFLSGIIVLWLNLSVARAQPEWGVAFKGGGNAATLAEDNRFNRYGLSGGVSGRLRWSLTDRFFIASQIEVLYTPRGATASLGDEYLGRVREHYFDLLLTARPEVRFGSVGVYLLLGGGSSILLSAIKIDAQERKEDITDGLRRVDATLVAGVGMALQLPGRKLGPFRLGEVFLEARRDHGLRDTVADGGYQNRATSLMLGFSFALARGSARTSPAPLPDPSASSARSGGAT